jgi:NADH:ubiquinone oxidoreductase subunit E
MDIDRKKLDTIIRKNGGESSRILAIYQDIQKEYRHLPQEAVRYVCGMLDIPVVKGYEVATFYKSLSLKPKGKHSVCVCLGTACHLKGGPAILETFERELKVKRDDTTEDGLFTVESVNCLGACALAPLVRVDGTDFGKTDPLKVKKIIKQYKQGA